MAPRIAPVPVDVEVKTGPTWAGERPEDPKQKE
jgi:hypothetical protein